MKNIAVILAGGVGERVGLNIPKQLIKIAGKPIIEHTLEIFQRNRNIDEIIVMMKPGYLDTVRDITRRNGFDKVSQILEGRDTRNSTTRAALEALPLEECNVILHDAVRPLVAPRILDDVVRALAEYEVVDVAIPSADTIIEVTEKDGRLPEIVDIPIRTRLRRGQTPQAFRLSTLREAYRLSEQDSSFAATDDCGVVLKYTPHVPIGVVDGEPRNMKITEPIDVYLADKLFQLYSDNGLPALEEGLIEDQLLGKIMIVFGGGYGIGHDIVRLAESYGCSVRSFSRSATKTHVDRREDVISARDQVLKEFGRVDYVVNTAGILLRGSLQEASEESIYEATEINYLGPIFIAQTFQAELARTRGSLLLFTSSSYTRGRSGYSLYSSAKAAVVNLTQALADEWAVDGIRVNCINPERTATPMRTRAFGIEDPETLLPSEAVAKVSVETLARKSTGQIIDVRKTNPVEAAVEEQVAVGEV